ncbi:MAG: valine--tRNA ligase [Thermoplasmata archaeon]
MNYEPKEIESKWQEFWSKEKIYRYDFFSNKETYSIDNPPRYASGALHLGHATHYTHIDIIARYKRMLGYNVFFPLCFDVNGMPIEVNVEKEKNVKMRDVDRHTFIKWCEEFAHSKIETMEMQFRILGESMDPSIYYQTDSPEYRRVTQLTFLDMAEKGLVYRGFHPVNWCPRCGTAIAESEIEYVEKKTKLYYIEFDLENSEKVTIATTRPELIPACLFLSYNENDKRYAKLKGKNAIIPIFGKKVPIISDDSIDMNFGTGIEMVCSIGDKNDLKLIKKHGFDIIKSINEEGKLTTIAGKYSNLYYEDARKKIIEDLENEHRILKIDEIDHNVGTCWRCGTPLEIINKEQWFIKTLDLKDEILKSINNIKWYPDFMKIRLEDWTKNLEWDWVVSRQRYFATPIPAWICRNGHTVYPKKQDLLNRMDYIDPTRESPPVKKCPVCGSELKGVEDVFDTWVDSSISPLYNAFLYRDGKKFKKLYPMSLRPQAHDIIRTWAFYSLLRCKVITGEEPWQNIFIDGHILAEDGRPMHASWGNVVDPLKIIEEYGTDAFRYFTATCMPGEDTPFRKREIIHGRKLLTKLWNVTNFMEINVESKVESSPLDIIDKWIISEFSLTVKNVTFYMNEYRFDRAIKEIDEFFWHVFADHYLEMVKFKVKTDANTKATLYRIFLGVVKLYAPFIPHITEEIYQRIFSKHERKISIHLEKWPEPYSIEFLEEGRRIRDLIATIRRWKIEHRRNSIKKVTVITDRKEIFEFARDVIINSLKIEDLEFANQANIYEKILKSNPDLSKLGPLLKNDIQEFIEKISLMNPEDLRNGIEFKGRYIGPENFKFEKATIFEGENVYFLNAGRDEVIIHNNI